MNHPEAKIQQAINKLTESKKHIDEVEEYEAASETNHKQYLDRQIEPYKIGESQTNGNKSKSMVPNGLAF